MGLFSGFIPKKPTAEEKSESPSGHLASQSKGPYTSRPQPVGNGRLLRQYGHVTPREFHEHFMAYLREKDIGHYQRERIEELATGFLDKDYGQIGMNHTEVRQFLDEIRSKRHEFNLTDEDMGHIEEGLAHEQ